MSLWVILDCGTLHRKRRSRRQLSRNQTLFRNIWPYPGTTRQTCQAIFAIYIPIIAVTTAIWTWALAWVCRWPGVCSTSQKFRRFMRKRIADIIQMGSFVFALGAAVFWMYFIWSFDWGHFGGRSWGLWFFFVFLIGALLVSFAVFLVFFWISSLVDPD
jgi:hypothetical protein